MKDKCVHYGKICIMPVKCKFHNDDRGCKLNGKIKTELVYIPKHIRPPDTVVFKNKYTLDGIGI